MSQMLVRNGEVHLPHHVEKGAVKLKNNCFQCGYFNLAMGRKKYKCYTKSCPARCWSREKINRVLNSTTLKKGKR